MARGMYTGPDGEFALPVTNLDNGSPGEVHAIKADYYFHDFVVPENIDVKRRPKEFFSNRHIYLMPQDPAKPEFRFSGGDEYCNGTTSKADAGAIIPFQQIAIEEVKKYGGPSDMIAGREGLVSRLVDLPSQAIEKDVKGQNK